MKGSYYGTISDQIAITCTGGESSATKLRALIDYKDEVSYPIPFAESELTDQSWLGKPRFLLDGVIYRYTPGNEEEESWTKPKQVPSDKVVANIEGCWMKEIKYRLKGEKVSFVVLPQP